MYTYIHIYRVNPILISYLGRALDHPHRTAAVVVVDKRPRFRVKSKPAEDKHL